jgi:gliding motility-associated-like protein
MILDMLRMRNLFGVVALPIFLTLLLSSTVMGQWVFPVIPGPGPNAATSLGGDCMQLTPLSANVRGVAWNTTQLDLSQPFDISLSVMQGPSSLGFGADGLALVLQREGLAAHGAGGNALGFAAAVPPDPNYTAITPSIAFELDTWPNQAAGVADINAHHIAIHQNGITTSALAGPTPALANSGAINDSSCHTFRVIWNPTTNNIRIFYPSATNLRLNANIDMINTVFGGNTDVWWGLTGASGNPGQAQVVCVGADFANAGPDTATCPGQPLQLNASGGVIYFWGQGFPIIDNQNIANPNFSSLIPLPYVLNVLATNIAGCNDRDTIVVTVEPNPTAVVGTGGQVCLGDSIQLGGPPNADYSYDWSPATNLSTTTGSQPWVVPPAPGSWNYQLIVVDTAGVAGCRDTATVAVTATDTPSVVVTAVPTTICLGDTTTITAAATGGTGTYTYLWSPGGATTATIQVNPTTATTYSVTVTDINTCSTIGTIDITVNDTPQVSVVAVPDTICAGQSTALAATPSGGTAPYTYLWSSGGTAQNETASPQATTTFVVSVTDNLGCTGTGSAVVVVNVSDSIDITVPDTFICNTGAIVISNTFSTSGIDTWNWLPTLGVSNTTSPNPILVPPVDTTYYLAGFNSLTGCGYIDSIHIDVFELDVVHFTDTTICLGDSVDFNLQPTGGSGGYSFVWLSTSQGYISDDSIGNPTVAPDVTTIYTGIVTDDTTGCQTTVNITVNVSPLIVQATPGSILINPGQRVQLQAFGAMFYAWSPDTMINCITCPDPVVTPLTSMTYTVLGWDTAGCQGTANVIIVIDPFLVPNVFSPNGDGINDQLLFNYHGNAFYEISVFDRWGVQIFTTTDKTAMWDGKTNGGGDAPEGVYYVAVRVVGDQAIDPSLKQHVFHVTLLR